MSTANKQPKQPKQPKQKIQKIQKIQSNDTVKVSLTAEGANILNTLNRRANSGFLLRSTVRFRTDYKQGEVYRDQLHHLMKVFGSGCDLGLEVPFTDLWMDGGKSENIL